MIQELIDAVNAYRLEHSKCEATGHRTSELNDTYVRMLLVCDAAQHSVQLTAFGARLRARLANLLFDMSTYLSQSGGG